MTADEILKKQMLDIFSDIKGMTTELQGVQDKIVDLYPKLGPRLAPIFNEIGSWTKAGLEMIDVFNELEDQL